MPTNLRFSENSDLFRFESSIRADFDRLATTDPRPFDKYHLQSVREIERRFSAAKFTADRFELGRLGERTREDLRDCAACFALHFLFVDSDTQGDAAGYFTRKAAYYWQRAESIFGAVRVQVDYDLTGDGTVDEAEKQRPAPAVFLRG